MRAPLLGLLLVLLLAAPAPAAVQINEVESDGAGSDFVELVNTGAEPVGVGGLVLRDATEADDVVVPAADVAPGGVVAVDVTGLGGADTARLFAADGTTLLDSYSWVLHAATSYGRCPGGALAIITTVTVTKGAANDCPALTVGPWPGSQNVTVADDAGALGTDVSGLAAPVSGGLWAVDNGGGELKRLTRSGDRWTLESTRALKYPGGGGVPDAVGVTVTPTGALYVSTERDGDAGGTSRLSVLRYDPAAAGATLTAEREWNLTATLPAVGPNAGLESIAFAPDDALRAQGFVDEATGAAYDPATYGEHGGGIFFVGLEANGRVYAFALRDDGSFVEVAEFASGFPTFAELEWVGNELWVVCDNTCDGRIGRFRVDDSTGRFAATAYVERPPGMPNVNNEGFTLTPYCTGGNQQALWADDGNFEGHVLRSSLVGCPDIKGPSIPPPPNAPPSEPTPPLQPVLPDDPPPPPSCGVRRTKLVVARALPSGRVRLTVRGKAKRLQRVGTRRTRRRQLVVRRPATRRVKVVVIVRGGRRRTVTLRLPACAVSID